MSDIFVSYDDHDRQRVRRIVDALEARGWSVWWDHRISTGEAFAKVIERELAAASCVVAVWTNTSVHSEWVRAEADEAWKLRKLVPVLLDHVKPPMPFGQIQAVDLVDWDEPDHQGFAKLLADLHERIGRAPAPIAQGTRETPFQRSSTAAGILAALLVAIVAIAWYVLQTRGERGGEDPEDVRAGPPAAGEPVPVTAAPDAAPDRSPPPGAEPSAVATKPSVPTAVAAGHWQAQVTYSDGASFEERFTFEVTEQELSGTASMRGYGYRRGITDGTIDGDRLSFRTSGTVMFSLASTRDVTYRYRGTVEGDAIRFTLDEGTGDPAVAFTATRISAEQANRIATGGTRPRLSFIDTRKLYSTDYIGKLVGDRQGAIDECYRAAEFDDVNHEHVDFDLTLSAVGEPVQLKMRPTVASLESCMRNVLLAIEWGPTATGQGDTMRLGITARLPWNP
jgi:hypothetical protein